MGSVGMDYLASVAAFPQPDDKLRTEQLETQGGGNCGNALTACSRLGLQPVVLTKIGNDSLGDAIIAELQDDGVDTSYVMRAEGSPSRFTYIIVDRTGGTRTCIHTPGAPLDPDEVTPEVADGLLAGARLVYFDGRLTEAAVVLAKVAKAAGIPVLVEAERLRPTLEQLLQYADYVVTSAHFPQDSTGEEALGDALVAMAQQLPQARWIVTTLGSRGSVLIDIEAARRSALDAPPPVAAMQEQVDSLLQQAAAGKAAAAAGRACLSKAGRFIAPPSIAGPSPLLQLSRSQADGGGAAAQRAAQAAQRAAAANADFGKGEAYAMAAAAESAADLITARIWAASSAGLRSDDVVDTTGAGDAFIGSLLYGIVTGMPVDRMLTLASVVAACKCSALGARPGLPQAAELAESLL